ncbi:hypothetical protein STAFG_5630 [Streptomyces afghaniensis 772]|uniref:Uncharacterized protein n=1 Tax=Streptomyces afghaniensis 772 TaxID=1283301 RepID=S4NG28_9ACTN|nr:hypothetical protein STAFG_5630 [Streptomyces afghaniensis 772]
MRGGGGPRGPRRRGQGDDLRTTAVRGIRETVGRYDLRPAVPPLRRALVSPVRGNVRPL